MGKKLTFLLLLIPAICLAQTVKQERVLRLAQLYFPVAVPLLDSLQERDFMVFAPGDGLDEWLRLPVLVHEAWHADQFYAEQNESMQFYLNDTLTISVIHQPAFPSREIVKYAPPNFHQMSFRFNTYVNTDDQSKVTQSMGMVGLMQELTAYYHELRTYVGLYDLLKDSIGWNSATAWQRYLGEAGSVIYAGHEFRIYSSWYLMHAYDRYPAIYHNLMADKSLKELYSFLVAEFDALNHLHKQHLDEIKRELEGRLIIEEGFAGTPNGRKTSTHMSEFNRLDYLLVRPGLKTLNDY